MPTSIANNVVQKTSIATESGQATVDAKNNGSQIQMVQDPRIQERAQQVVASTLNQNETTQSQETQSAPQRKLSEDHVITLKYKLNIIQESYQHVRTMQADGLIQLSNAQQAYMANLDKELKQLEAKLSNPDIGEGVLGKEQFIVKYLSDLARCKANFGREVLMPNFAAFHAFIHENNQQSPVLNIPAFDDAKLTAARNEMFRDVGKAMFKPIATAAMDKNQSGPVRNFLQPYLGKRHDEMSNQYNQIIESQNERWNNQRQVNSDVCCTIGAACMGYGQTEIDYVNTPLKRFANKVCKVLHSALPFVPKQPFKTPQDIVGELNRDMGAFIHATLDEKDSLQVTLTPLHQKLSVSSLVEKLQQQLDLLIQVHSNDHFAVMAFVEACQQHNALEIAQDGDKYRIQLSEAAHEVLDLAEEKADSDKMIALLHAVDLEKQLVPTKSELLNELDAIVQKRLKHVGSITDFMHPRAMDNISSITKYQEKIAQAGTSQEISTLLVALNKEMALKKSGKTAARMADLIAKYQVN